MATRVWVVVSFLDFRFFKSNLSQFLIGAKLLTWVVCVKRKGRVSPFATSSALTHVGE